MVRMAGMAGLVHDCVEPVFLVGGVLDRPQGAVGVVHAVRSLHHVAVPVLVRGFVVAGVRILYAVLVRVLGMGLRFLFYGKINVINVTVFDSSAASLRYTIDFPERNTSAREEDADPTAT